MVVFWLILPQLTSLSIMNYKLTKRTESGGSFDAEMHGSTDTAIFLAAQMTLIDPELLLLSRNICLVSMSNFLLWDESDISRYFIKNIVSGESELTNLTLRSNWRVYSVLGTASS